MAKKSRRERREAARAEAKQERPGQQGGGGGGGGGGLSALTRSWPLRRVAVAGGAVAAIVVALLIGLSGGGSSAGLVDLPTYLNEEDRTVAARTSALAPDFELETIEGERFRLSDLRGHPVLLNFWATWCGPCREEMPTLVALANQFREEGLVVVGVNIEESRGEARDFVNEFQMPFAVPMDFGGGVSDRYIQTGPPQTMMIRPDGTIATSLIGGQLGATFVAEVNALLGEITDPLGGEVLAGPKAVPTALVPEGLVVGAAAGAVAPDFVLDRHAGGRWRLTEQRGTPLLVVFEPLDCSACGERSSEAAAAGQSAGYAVIVVTEAGGTSVEGATGLAWRQDVAALFGGASAQRFVVVGADGVVQAVAGESEDVGALLAGLGAAGEGADAGG